MSVGVRVLQRAGRRPVRRAAVRSVTSACAVPEDGSEVVHAPWSPPATSSHPEEVPGQLELFPGPPPPADDVLDLPETEVWWEVAVPDLAPAGSLRRVQQLHALVARAESLRTEALAVLQGSGRSLAADASVDRPAAGVVDEAVVDELAPLLAMGRTAVRRRLQEAEQLSRCLPRTAALLAEGLVDYPQVAAVVRETALLSEGRALEVDAGVVGDLVGATTGAVAELVRAEVARVDAEAVRERSRALTRGRRVLFTPLADGMASLTATGPAPQVRSWWELLDAGSRDRTRPAAQHDPYAEALAERGTSDSAGVGDRADRSTGGAGTGLADERGADARRFDALGELVEQGFGAAPAVGLGAGPEVVVALSTLVGADDDPARLDGYGPVPAWLARAVARARRARVALVDRHDGRLLGVDPQAQPPGVFTALARGAGTTPDSRTVSAGTSQGGTAAGAPSPEPSSAPLRGPSSTPPGEPSSVPPGEPSSTPPGEPFSVPSRGPSGSTTEGPVTDADSRTAGGTSGGARRGSPPDAAGPAGPGRSDAVAPAAPRTGSGAGDRGRCAVADAGGGPYAIPAGVRRAVRTRSRRCCAPGCRVPSKRCDLDHVVAWPAGPTCPCNLLPLCRTHHRMKHERGWTLVLVRDDPDDPLGVDGLVIEWRSPAGVRHLVRPEPLLHRRSGDRPAGLRGARGPDADRVAGDDVTMIGAAAGGSRGGPAGRPWSRGHPRPDEDEPPF